MSTKRVLLSSATTPLGPRYGDGLSVGYELLHGQVTRAQGVFSPRAVHTQFGLDYIAANIDTPTVTLQYPSERDFARELATGDYTHVGISFNITTAHRMRRMVAIARRVAPRTSVVLGGYGTAIPEEHLRPYADEICHGEGVAFMRELLGEPAREPPFDHPLVVSTLRLLGVPVSKTGLIFGGLGCPNGCDFCSTSHYFERKHLSLLPTGGDLLDVVEAYRGLVPDIEFTVLDEDFLLNRERAMRFRELLLERGLHLDMFVFASVKALSLYTAQELVELGVGGVWIGYEGLRAGYDKLEGRPLPELFEDLKNHGILVLTSMILGLGYQTEEIVREEFEGLMALEPTYSQYLIYGPTPGTPLGDRIDREKRWRAPFDVDREARWRHSDGFTCLVQHPHMAPERIEALQQDCYTEDYRRLGPSVLRTAEVWQTGRAHLARRREPALRRREAYLGRRLARIGGLLPLFRLLAPSAGVERRVRNLRRPVRAVTSPGAKAQNALIGALSLPAAGLSAILLRSHRLQHPTVGRSDWSGTSRPPVANLRGRIPGPATPSPEAAPSPAAAALSK